MDPPVLTRGVSATICNGGRASWSCDMAPLSLGVEFDFRQRGPMLLGHCMRSRNNRLPGKHSLPLCGYGCQYVTSSAKI